MAVGQRFSNHKYLLARGAHHSKKLQNSWNKHGSHSFVFSILAVYDNEDLMLAAEQELILTRYEDSYNISTEVGRCHLRGKHHTEETKQKISAKLTGRHMSAEARHKMSIAKTGIKHSEDTKQKMRLAKLGGKCSESAKQKISLANRGRKAPRVKIQCPIGVIIGYAEAAKQFGVSRNTILEWVKHGKTGWSANLTTRNRLNKAF